MIQGHCTGGRKEMQTMQKGVRRIDHARDVVGGTWMNPKMQLRFASKNSASDSILLFGCCC